MKTTRGRTGAQRVVCTLELLARCIVLALGSDALEVVRVVLEAVAGYERATQRIARWMITSVSSGSCWGTGLYDRQALQNDTAASQASGRTVEACGLQDVFAIDEHALAMTIKLRDKAENKRGKVRHGGVLWEGRRGRVMDAHKQSGGCGR